MNNCIIELTGVPCSGKSHFVKKTINIKNNIVLLTCHNIKLVIVGFFLLQYSLLYQLLKFSFREDVSYIYRVKIFFNVLKKFGVYASYEKKDKFGYIDEGVSHIPFNFLSTDTYDVVSLLSPFLSQLNVKLISCDEDSILKTRLLSRGHKRLNYTNVSEFIKMNRDVESILLIIYPKICSNFEVVKNA